MTRSTRRSQQTIKNRSFGEITKQPKTSCRLRNENQLNQSIFSDEWKLSTNFSGHLKDCGKVYRYLIRLHMLTWIKLIASFVYDYVTIIVLFTVKISLPHWLDFPYSLVLVCSLLWQDFFSIIALLICDCRTFLD